MKSLPKTVAVSLMFVVVIFLGTAFRNVKLSISNSPLSTLHSPLSLLDSLPEGFNGLFASSGKCDNCHGFDPAGIASVDLEGGDVNVVDDWRSTMMANSAKDPFWRAKVSHEVLINPAHQSALETKCTSCHSPLGHFAAFFSGATDYSIAEMMEDSIALDGVSCLACHQQSTVQLGNIHSGNLHFTSAQIAYGPFTDPLITPMALASGYTPEFSTHINDAGICAGCHTLITETADLDGNLTGTTFVEQATYHEWLNSSYNTDGITCQGCHLPRLIDQPVKLAAGFDTPPRAPFALHTLVGGNTFMLKLMKDNMAALNIAATSDDFNQTIAATMDMLQNKSIEVEVTEEGRTADSLFINVKLINKAGHKLPSGFPSRKMSVHFKVYDEDDNEIFHSGKFSDEVNYYLEAEDEPFEPHHNIINNQNDVQVYEMVMADVENNFTTVLERAASSPKDNRLVPLGFSTSSEVYDTTKIVGDAFADEDFNHDPLEGSGTDIIHYRIPLNGFADEIFGEVSVYYQSLPPTWMEEIFSATTPEIDSFETMFYDADQTPVLMVNESFSVEEYVSVDDPAEPSWGNVYSASGFININAKQSLSVSVYDAAGKLCNETRMNESDRKSIKLLRGTYLVVINKRWIEKVVVR